MERTNERRKEGRNERMNETKRIGIEKEDIFLLKEIVADVFMVFCYDIMTFLSLYSRSGLRKYC